jgi:hypothetical protein
MSKLKKEYLRTVMPHMNIVAEACKSFNIPMFATFQVAPQEFNTFCLNEEKSNWAKLKMMCYMEETWSVDEFLEKLMQDALENGHDSLYLSSMGIPRRPDDSAISANRISSLREMLKKSIDIES